MNKNIELWKHLDFDHIGHGESIEVNAKTIGLVPLIKSILLKDSGYISEYTKEGYVKQELDNNEKGEPMTVCQKYINYFTKKGGRLIFNSLEDYGRHIFIWDNSIVSLVSSSTWISIESYSSDESFNKEIKNYLDTQWAPPEKKGHIYAIVRNGGHLSLSSIGNASVPLVSGNYTSKVIEDYEYVIKDLKSKSPSGRISIMTGIPGSGKTHLIRAMLLEVPEAMFVLVSPDMVVSLAGPELLPLLLSHRGLTTGPIILVLEDADKCLVARDKENMNSIQSLLNLGDGILGSLLDLRIVATTNAKELHMEEAIMRPGRLSKMLQVGALDLKTAQKIYWRLLQKENLPHQLDGSGNMKKFNMTLAEVYALARKNGWSPDAS